MCSTVGHRLSRESARSPSLAPLQAHLLNANSVKSVVAYEKAVALADNDLQIVTVGRAGQQRLLRGLRGALWRSCGHPAGRRQAPGAWRKPCSGTSLFLTKLCARPLGPDRWPTEGPGPAGLWCMVQAALVGWFDHF